ncbi:MAG: gamma-glutamyltransferase [Kiloniellales bacterium]
MKTQLGVIAAGHEVTASAGEEMLRAGGNAYDAVLAAVLAASVAEPALSSLGGGGFLLAAQDGQAPLVYDFFVQTPAHKKSRAELDFYPIQGDFGGTFQEFHIGLASSAVPGLVRGLFAVHEDLCRMPMREIVAPAVRYAREGVVMSAFQDFILNRVVRPIFVGSEACRTIYGSRKQPGALALEGERTTNPELAAVFEALAMEGPELFYRGEIAQAIDRAMQDGGLITLADLAAYQAIRRRPLEIQYHGTRIAMNPPPAAGGLLIAFGLKLLEQASLHALVPGSDDHLLVLADVLEKSTQARADTEAAGEAGRVLDETFLARYRSAVQGHARAHRGTTHISAIDGEGNMAALTVTNGEGCGFVVPGTGIHMNNMLGEEDLNPRGFMTWSPATRLSSMMTPSTLHWPDGRRAALGSGGSNRIRTALLQFLVNMIDFEMSAEEAVRQPRIHLDHDGLLQVEGGFEGELGRLAERYPDMNRWAELNMYFGGTHVASIDETGFHGAGDPRRSGACKVVT